MGKKTVCSHNRYIVNEAFGDGDGFIGTGKRLLNSDGIVFSGTARDSFGMLIAYFERHPDLCTNNTANSLKVVGDAINQVIVRQSKKINTNNMKSSDFDVETMTPNDAKSDLAWAGFFFGLDATNPLEKRKLRKVKKAAMQHAMKNGASKREAEEIAKRTVSLYKRGALQSAKKQAAKQAALQSAKKQAAKKAVKFVGKGVAKLFCGPIGWAWLALDVVVAGLDVLDAYENAKNPLRPVYTAMDNLRKFFSSHQKVNTPAVKQALSVINSSIRGVRKPNEWTAQEKSRARQNMQKTKNKDFHKQLYNKATGKEWVTSPKQTNAATRPTTSNATYGRSGKNYTQNGYGSRTSVKPTYGQYQSGTVYENLESGKNNNNTKNTQMKNTSNRNERVFYLTEGDIREIVSECTAAVLNEGGGPWLRKGFKKLANSKVGKKAVSKGKKWIDDIGKRFKARPKASNPSGPTPQQQQYQQQLQRQLQQQQQRKGLNLSPATKVLIGAGAVGAATWGGAMNKKSQQRAEDRAAGVPEEEVGQRVKASPYIPTDTARWRRAEEKYEKERQERNSMNNGVHELDLD